jgi:hypothetical protein
MTVLVVVIVIGGCVMGGGWTTDPFSWPRRPLRCTLFSPRSSFSLTKLFLAASRLFGPPLRLLHLHHWLRGFHVPCADVNRAFP